MCDVAFLKKEINHALEVFKERYDEVCGSHWVSHFAVGLRSIKGCWMDAYDVLFERAFIDDLYIIDEEFAEKRAKRLLPSKSFLVQISFEFSYPEERIEYWTRDGYAYYELLCEIDFEPGDPEEPVSCFPVALDRPPQVWKIRFCAFLRDMLINAMKRRRENDESISKC